MVFILGMVAFSVDVSWMVLTQSELQNAADAAALAGANRLGENFAQYSLPGQTSTNKTTLFNQAVANAKTSAKTFASRNSAGGVNALTLLDADIEIGYSDASGGYQTTSPTSTAYPNTVKVVLRRDTSANTPLNLFFAPILGVAKANLTARATATLYQGTINNFRVSESKSGMLPVAYDINDWANFMKTGKDPDGKSIVDSAGNPVLQVYPSIKDKGNFGLLSLNDSHVGASTISNWIANGISPSEIQSLQSNQLIPLSAHSVALWDWQGENGFKASNLMDMNAKVGTEFVLPLFTPKQTGADYEAGVGQGSNYFYNISGFVGVKIVESPSKNQELWVQPFAISDPNILFLPGSVVPLGAGSTTFSVIAPAKLTS